MSEIERPSSEIERVPRHVVVPREAPSHRRRSAEDAPFGEDYGGHPGSSLDGESGSDWARIKPLLQQHPVTAGCLALILASLIWKAAFISHYYFQNDDFNVFDVSLHSKLSWSFLTHADAGHLFPGVYAIAWVLARTALYNWTAASAITLVMIAAASLAAWRLLRTLLGNRPAILIPLAFYLLSPIAFPVYSWWITAIEAIPLQIAAFMALDAHVRYVRSGHFRHAVAAAGWLVLGLIFFEKAVAIPALLFAVTAGFLMAQPLLSSIWVTLIRLWKAWVLYLALLAAYAAVLIGSLNAAKAHSSLSSFHTAATFASELLRDTFLPSVLGGPWQWFYTGGATSAGSAPPSVLGAAAVLAAAAVIVASILVRRRAWRAWAILAGWIILDDVLPVALGRLSFPGADILLGHAARYAMDASAILAIAIALAFWPVAGPQEQLAGTSARRREFFGGRWKSVALGLTAVLVIGSVWSVRDLEDVSGGGPVRSYIATARAAIAAAPRGTVIAGGERVPGDVMSPLFLQDANAAVVLEPLSHRGTQLSWPTQLAGTIDHLMVFGSTGQLYPASVIGTTTTAVPQLSRSCTSPKTGLLTLQFPHPTSVLTSLLLIPYITNAPLGQFVTVSYGTTVQRVYVQPSPPAHNAYLPVAGSASTVTFRSAKGVLFCPSGVTAGEINVPQSTGPGGIPASPLAG